MKTFFGGDGECLVGNRTFRRPQASGLRAKNSLVILASKPQVLARIFGTAVGAARQRRAGIGDAGDIGIADQRKDGVVEGSGAEFDLAALRRITIWREQQAQELDRKSVV